MVDCDGCPNNRGWDIFERSEDNRLAVERCDMCARLPDDESAAVLARAIGIQCDSDYPCYVRLSHADDCASLDCAYDSRPCDCGAE